MTKIWNIVGEEGMKNLAKDFLDYLKPKPNQATCVTLSGELGAGKTTFTKCLAHELGISELIQSPTFVIARFYPIKTHFVWKQLIHVDAYRLEGTDDIAPLGLGTYSKDPHTLIVLEWPEKVLPLPFTTDYEIYLTHTTDGKGRKIELK